MHFRLTTYRRKKLAKEQIIRNMDDKIKQLSEAGGNECLYMSLAQALMQRKM